jgi:ATP-dependent protease ClpP protease subunit
VQLLKDMDRNYWMSADEAKKYGIVDDILKPKKK